MEALVQRRLPPAGRAQHHGVVHEARGAALTLRAPSSRAVSASSSATRAQHEIKSHDDRTQPQLQTGRRALLGAVLSTAVIAGAPSAALAVQGATAGRIPGVSKTPDDEGFYQYTRPEGKSGGHGVGWSEIPRYKFRVPAGWEEVPVSIADLGGTEIDLRFASKDSGDLSVVVAPILRFKDVGYNAKVSIDEIGPPGQVLAGFAPELFGQPLDDEAILDTKVYTDRSSGLLYYQWEVKMKNHVLATCTATGNRVFILTVTAKERQFQKHRDDLQKIAQSFYVPAATA